MKAIVAALAVTAALPAAASAHPTDLRYDSQVRSSSLGAAPAVQVPKHLPAMGTDVAAPDQQSPIEPASRTPVPASPSASDDFAWNDALAGAGATLGAFTLALGGAAVVKRRRVALR